jgi:hypothetical protein
MNTPYLSARVICVHVIRVMSRRACFFVVVPGIGQSVMKHIERHPVCGILPMSIQSTHVL